ncbi:MAG TPA: hypothetical protein VFY67_04350 [Pyrinomonadaceae bacterium]|nr:hypothetical protein [Pyrinomonadaceae bacterium]
MQTVLDLQKLEIPDPDLRCGGSCTSSLATCCGGGADNSGFCEFPD